MSKRICSIDGCERPVNTGELCNGHQKRKERGRSLTDRPISRAKYHGCRAEGCDRKHKMHGWCAVHAVKVGYGRVAIPKRSRAELFWEKVEKTDSCWNWTASTLNGYGVFGIENRRTMPSHRYAYELLVGPIPTGMQLDHICHNRSCVNPDHLRPVTPGQNNQNHRGAKANSQSGIRGVSPCKQEGRWQAQVAVNGKRYHVGRFDSLEEAEAAVIAKRLELHTHNDADRR